MSDIFQKRGRWCFFNQEGSLVKCADFEDATVKYASEFDAEPEEDIWPISSFSDSDSDSDSGSDSDD